MMRDVCFVGSILQKGRPANRRHPDTYIVCNGRLHCNAEIPAVHRHTRIEGPRSLVIRIPSETDYVLSVAATRKCRSFPHNVVVALLRRSFSRRLVYLPALPQVTTVLLDFTDGEVQKHAENYHGCVDPIWCTPLRWWAN